MAEYDARKQKEEWLKEMFAALEELRGRFVSTATIGGIEKILREEWVTEGYGEIGNNGD